MSLGYSPHVQLSAVSCRPSCLQVSVMGLWVPRLSQAQTLLSGGLLSASLSSHPALTPSSPRNPPTSTFAPVSLGRVLGAQASLSRP